MIALALAASLLVPAAAPAGPWAQAQLANGNTEFALALYQRLASDDPKANLFLSPYIISSALAMTYAGARGPTAKEMASVLRFGSDDAALHLAFSQLRRQLASPADKSFELALANRLFPATGYKLLDSFVALTRDRYGAPVEPLDFQGAKSVHHPPETPVPLTFRPGLDPILVLPARRLISAIMPVQSRGQYLPRPT